MPSYPCLERARAMPAWYRCHLTSFDAEKAYSALLEGVANSGFPSTFLKETEESWREEIACFERLRLHLLRTITASEEWTLLLEYEIPRRSKRIDAVLLTDHVVIVVEFKAGAGTFESSARCQ